MFEISLNALSANACWCNKKVFTLVSGISFMYSLSRCKLTNKNIHFNNKNIIDHKSEFILKEIFLDNKDELFV